MAVTGSRREARERALGLCYELEVRDLGVDALIEQQPAPPDAYAVQLVRGVEEHHADVDALLRKFSEHWALERMPAVDRAVLRLARLRARVGTRDPERGGDQRSRRAGQAVLHEGLRTLRQRAAQPHRGGAPAGDASMTAPVEVQEPAIDELTVTDKPWIVIVWNDPVNLMTYVVYVFQKLFGYSRKKATRLMRQVHEEGKAVVSDGPIEKCEADVARLHAHGLWATMEHPRMEMQWRRGRMAGTPQRNRPCDAALEAVPLRSRRHARGVARRGGARAVALAARPAARGVRGAAPTIRRGRRLFPRAYLDPTAESEESEWQALVHPSLLRERLDALELITATLVRASVNGDWWQIALTPDEVQAWLGVLNDTRLVLGTTLGVTEEERELDPADPEAGAYAMYQWLTWLQGDLVEALL